MFGLGELFDSEKSYIKDGYYNLIIVDEDNNVIDLQSYLDCDKFEKIQKLNLEIINK